MISQRFLKNTLPLKRQFATLTGKQYMDLEQKFFTFHYQPQPVVLERGEGVHVWDVNGKQYLDCIAGVGACNQGHVHPKILQAFVHQASKITLTSRAFHNTQLGEFGKYITEMLGYDKFIPMNTGVEGDETAIKIMRRWAYRDKGVEEDKAMVLFPTGNFWGRSIAARSNSENAAFTHQFGPFNPGFENFKWNDAEDLEAKLKANPNIAGVVIEPIQGEGGILMPKPGFMKQVHDLCEKYNVLMCVDEIQTGFGRTGKMMAIDHEEEVFPDMMVLGKSLSGGMLPISGVVADNHIMNHIKPGDHGCTYGGNPLAMAVAHASVKVLIEEGMIENSRDMGKLLLDELQKIESPIMKDIRGRGLMLGLEVEKSGDIQVNGVDLVNELRKQGVLTIKAKDQTARLMPPLVITKD